MIPRAIRAWLGRMWQTQDDKLLLEAYDATFSSFHGQIVLQHLVDTVYCTVYEGTDPHEALAHNSRRSVIQDLLENLDRVKHPQKYIVEIQQETADGAR